MLFRRLVTGSAVVLSVVLVAASPASAATVSTPLATGLLGPLQIAVGSDGTLYVGENFAARLTAISRDGTSRTLASVGGPDDLYAEVAGVAADGRGTVTFTSSVVHGDGSFSGLVQRVQPNGRLMTLGDVGNYEATVNPDHVNSYGFSDLDTACASQVPPEIGADPYSGIVDAHPYSVAIMPDGSRIVGDAAGNDLVRVGANGGVSTLAVLPPQPLVLTQDMVDENNAGTDEEGNPNPILPDCVVGHAYAFEPVPTDVELGPDGMLYVSTLPGGPESPAFAGRGSVYRVDPASGTSTRIATGFTGSTNLAVAPDGTVYVAELFADQVSKVVAGAPVAVASVTMPAALEWANGKLYASTDTFGAGNIVTITP